MTLPRLHLFELEDQSWCPRMLRDYATDYLQAIQDLYPIDETLVEPLASLLEASGETRIVDLCSGAGGPVIGVCQALGKQGLKVEVTLTDFFPNVEAFEHAARRHPAVRFEKRSIDAQAVPANLEGVRTVFNGIHHFRPRQVEAIFADAVRQGMPVGVFEMTKRSIPSVLGMLLSPLMVWILTPKIRPFRWSRLLFTYLIPLVPLIVLWDGVVSQLRGYEPHEFEEMGKRAGPEYRWRSGRIQAGPVPITFLTGHPDPTGHPEEGP
ncbi:MAG: hypothetical protein AAGA81_05775 [Acidobacteriota bacterium]